MKKLVLLSVFVISFLFSGCFKKPNHKVKLGYLTSNFNTPTYLNGRVKEYTQVTYLAKLEDNVVVRGKQRIHSKVPRNATNWHATFYFDKKGKMEKATFYDDNGNPDRIAHYIYENGKLSEVVIKKGEYLWRRDKMFYEAGRITKIEIYNNTGGIFKKHLYEYNDNGHIIKEVRLDRDGKHINSQEFQRLENGNWKYSVLINRYGTMVNKAENVYDENGVFVARNWIFRGERNINEKGKQIFEYDKNGNWIKLVRYRNNIPFNITERTFVYY